MVTTLSVNEVNDIYINNFNNIDLSVDLEAVKNLCKNAAQAQRGEMIYNTNQGVPTKQTLWQGSPNLIQFELALREQLTDINGVQRVLNLQTSISGETVKYTAIIQTDFGSTTLNGGL